jgi:hypothetical protein
MFGMDITGKHMGSGNNPAGEPQDGFKDGFYFSPFFCQLLGI